MANLSTKTGLPSFSAVDESIVNYFSDPGFERGTDGTLPSGWLQYNDGAVAVPVDGTGGSANVNVTLLTTISGPIRGTKSAVLTKGPGNQQGTGYSYDFTISNVDKGVTAGVDFELVTSAAYASGDVVFYIYDVTNSVLITPRAVSLPALPNYGKFFTDYGLQTGTQYRFILHIATTNASAWTITLDSMTNSTTRTAVPGAQITEWQDYTPVGSWSTNTSYSGKYRQVGSNLEVEIKISLSGAPSGTLATVSLPSGYSLNTNVLPSTEEIPVGSIFLSDTGTQTYTGSVSVSSVTTLLRLYGNDDAVGGVALTNITPTAPFTFAAGDYLRIEASVPILQLSGSGTNGAASVTQWASDDGTSDVLGPQGSLVPNVAFSTGATNRDFSFSIPQDLRQFVRCDLNYRGFGWSSASDLFPFFSGNNANSANSYGVQAYWISSTVFRVTFGNRGTNVSATNVDDGGSSWATEFAAGTRFRVGLSIGGVFIGINEATDTRLGFSYKNRFHRKVLTGNITSSGAISEWSFSNLVIGKIYRLDISARMVHSSSADNQKQGIVTISHSGSTLYGPAWDVNPMQTGDQYVQATSTFVATATTITMTWTGVNMQLWAPSYASLTEMNDTENAAVF